MPQGTLLKLSALVVVLGLTIGAWRSWQVRHSDRPPAGSDAGVAQLELLTSADKANWVRSQVYVYNHLDQQQRIAIHYHDSRVAMQQLLAGAEKPVIWSPDSPIWIARASDVWQKRTGRPLVQMDDAWSYHVYLRSPVVFLTTREKAAYLRKFLGGPTPWEAIREMSLAGKQPPWGKLRFSHSDPLESNSGIAVMGMILSEYARDHGGAHSYTEVASDPRFGQYLGDVEQGLLYDGACRQGTAALAYSYTRNLTSRDFIVTYENIALSAAMHNPDLVVIYPDPTEVAEQSVCLVDGPWVTAPERASAVKFMQYISQPQALKDGLRYNMRPAESDTETTLDMRLAAYRSQGFQQTYASEDAPPYDALNIAAAQWAKHVRH